MERSALAGNPRLKELLSQREEGRGLSHAYIISGPAGSGRHTLARLLTGMMVCSAAPGKRPCGACAQCKKVAAGVHPDLSVISGPEAGKPISVSQIRSLRSDAHIRPNEGDRKVYLLEQADQMKDEAQNAMLKLLEEGPKYAVFLFITENAGGLLQTVRSRCEELTLAPVPLGECEQWLSKRFPNAQAEAVRQAALDCQGILGRAVEQLEGTGEETRTRQERVRALADVLERGSELELFEATLSLDKAGKEEWNRLMDALESELTGRMIAGGDRRRLFRAVELVRQIKQAIRFNANPGQLAGWLCAGLFADRA